jgi:hypothetical protein
MLKLKFTVYSGCQALDRQLAHVLQFRRQVKDFNNSTRNSLVASIRLEGGTLRTIAKALKDSGICAFDYVNDVACRGISMLFICQDAVTIIHRIATGRDGSIRWMRTTSWHIRYAGPRNGQCSVREMGRCMCFHELRC